MVLRPFYILGMEPIEVFDCSLDGMLQPLLKLIFLDLVEDKFKHSFEHHRIIVFAACVALFSFHSLFTLSDEKIFIFSFLLVMTAVIEVPAKKYI